METKGMIDFNDLRCLSMLIDLALAKRDKSKVLVQWFYFNGMVIKLRRHYKEVYKAQMYNNAQDELLRAELLV